MSKLPVFSYDSRSKKLLLAHFYSYVPIKQNQEEFNKLIYARTAGLQ